MGRRDSDIVTYKSQKEETTWKQFLANRKVKYIYSQTLKCVDPLENSHVNMFKKIPVLDTDNRSLVKHWSVLSSVCSEIRSQKAWTGSSSLTSLIWGF